jgi:hypothetical protein
MKSPTVVQKPAIAPPPPPEKAPAELEDAVDSNATSLKMKKMGAKGAFGKKTATAQYAGSAAKTGLKIL